MLPRILVYLHRTGYTECFTGLCTLKDYTIDRSIPIESRVFKILLFILVGNNR